VGEKKAGTFSYMHGDTHSTSCISLSPLLSGDFLLQYCGIKSSPQGVFPAVLTHPGQVPWNAALQSCMHDSAANSWLGHLCVIRELCGKPDRSSLYRYSRSPTITEFQSA
jgi:hypothetical protein